MPRYRLTILLCCVATCILASQTFAQPAAKGPILRIRPVPFDFDSSRCGITKCGSIAIRNEGDTALVFRRADALRPPFSGVIDTPFTLQPGEQRTFRFCYRPNTMSRDSQRVLFRADNRVPLSVALLFDVSASMNVAMSDGKTRIAAANAAGRDFAGSLLYTAEIQDEGAVYTYEHAPNFRRVQDYTTNRSQLQAAIPAIAQGTSTCTYMALAATIDELRLRTQHRILIILTDGDDTGPSCGPATVDSIISAALAADIRIYTVTIGQVARAALERISNMTGGRFYNASSSLDLLAIYRQIATSVSQDIPGSFLVSGYGVSPVLRIEPDSLAFDSVRIGQTACRDVVIRNSGTAWMHIDSVARYILLPYDLRDVGVDSIPPGGSAQGRICFTPWTDGDLSRTLAFRSSACDQSEIRIPVTAFAIPRDVHVPRTPLLRIEVIGQAGDTTFCRTTECRIMRFTNHGDTALTVHAVDSIRTPFSGTVPVPFTLAAQESRSFTVCYHPPDAPRLDTQRVHAVADTRLSHRIAMVLDTSEAMMADAVPGISRLEALRTAALESFALMYDRFGMRDETVLGVFGGIASWRPVLGPTPDRLALRDALPRTAAGSPACVNDAILRAILAVRGAPERAAIIVITAGQRGTGCGAFSEHDVVAQAVAEKVRVFVMDLGALDPGPLRTIASGSGGAYVRPESAIAFVDSMRALHSHFPERTTLTAVLEGRGVTPVPVLRPDTIVVPSTAVDSSACRSISIQNTGEAPLRLERLLGPTHPWTITGDVTTELLPGASRDLTVCFRPDAPGSFRDSVVIEHTGCMTPPLRLLLHGSAHARLPEVLDTVDGGPGWRIARAILDPVHLDFGRIACGTAGCLPVTIRNSGDTLLVVTAISLPSGTRYSIQQPPLPIAIAPGDSVRVILCYSAHDSAQVVDTTTVGVRSNSRQPHATVLVLDAHASGDSVEVQPGLTRFDAAIRTGRLAVARLSTDNGIIDEAALIIAGNPPRIVHEFSGYKNSLLAALPAQPMAGDAAVRDAVRSGIDAVSRRTGIRHVVLLATGAERGGLPSDVDLIAAAGSGDVRVSVLAFGGDTSGTLREVCAATGGNWISVQSWSDAENALRRIWSWTETTVQFDAVARTGVPALRIEPDTLDFGGARPGVEVCATLRLRNTGDVPLTVPRLMFRAAGIDLTNIGPILPGADTTLRCCMLAPSQPEFVDTVVIMYTACGERRAEVIARVRRADSLTLAITGEWSVPPGRIITVPVRLLGTLDVDQDVRHLSFTVTANKWLIEPERPVIVTTGGLAAAPGVRVEEHIEYAWDSVRVTGTLVSATPLSATGPETLVAGVRLRTLLGRTPDTDIVLTGSTTSPGTPSMGRISDARVALDSVCFLERRLLSVRGSALVSIRPHPVAEQASLRYRVDGAGTVTIRILSLLGTTVATLVDGSREAGEYETVVDARGLPRGVYIVRMDAQDGASTARLVVR